MTVEELLAVHTPHIADLAERIIDHLHHRASWAETRVYAGWHGVGFHHAEAGYVVGVFPRDESVRVLFEHGHLLGDAPYLEGSGQTRVIDFGDWDADRIASIDDVLDRALSA